MSMALARWSSDFENGITWQDQQHQELIKAIHQLYTAIASRQDEKSIEDIIDFLYNYTKDHFDMEERCMEAYHYHDMDEHIFQHRGFIKTLENFVKERKTAKTLAVLTLCYDLNDWTINHIKTTDRHLAEFLRMEGVH